MEFLFALGIVFLIFITLLLVVFDKQIEINNSKKTLEKLSECQRVANLITSIASSSNGAAAEFDTSYYVKITTSGSIYANDENSNYNEVACRYIANPLSKNFYGHLKIQKIGGLIYLE